MSGILELYNNYNYNYNDYIYTSFLFYPVYTIPFLFYSTPFLFYPVCDVAYVSFYAPLETCQYIADETECNDGYQYAIDDIETTQKKYTDWEYNTQECNVLDENPIYTELFTNNKMFDSGIEEIGYEKFVSTYLPHKIFSISKYDMWH